MNVSLIESAGGSTNPFYSVYHGTYEALIILSGLYWRRFELRKMLGRRWENSRVESLPLFIPIQPYPSSTYFCLGASFGEGERGCLSFQTVTNA